MPDNTEKKDGFVETDTPGFKPKPKTEFKITYRLRGEDEALTEAERARQKALDQQRQELDDVLSVIGATYVSSTYPGDWDRFNIQTVDSQRESAQRVFFRLIPNDFIERLGKDRGLHIIKRLLMGVSEIAIAEINLSKIHEQLSPEAKMIQATRYSPESLLNKIMRPESESPHDCVIALDISTGILKVIGAVFFDPQVESFCGDRRLQGDNPSDLTHVRTTVVGRELKGLFVHPEYQKRKVATELVETLMRESFHRFDELGNRSSNPNDRVLPLVALIPNNPIAKIFFKTAGFNEVGEASVDIRANGLEEKFWFYLAVFSVSQQYGTFGLPPDFISRILDEEIE